MLKSEENEQNQLIIEKYLVSYRNEINITPATTKGVRYTLSSLSKYFDNKPFVEITADNIQAFLNSLRVDTKQDPLHKWIGTYNLYLVHIVRFFKWLSYPEYAPKERFKPKCIMNLKQLHRREKSIYKPTDLWTTEDDLLFLKYCPSKRIKCYHMVSRDSSSRPSEILNLKIKDLVFKQVENKQYVEILVNGKTGTRHIPLINSLPYIKDYLAGEHPMPSNPNSAFISGLGKSYGKHLTNVSLNMIYDNYKKEYFPKLLKDITGMVTTEDKNAIAELLKKPWNPYIRRHSALTDKSKYLKESVLKQHAGWSSLSGMPEKYLHYFGNESSESILEAMGIKPSTAKEVDKLKPKQCPNCDEGNKTDARFCAKCRMILSYDAYTEASEERQIKDDALTILSDQIAKLTAEVQELKSNAKK